MQAGVYSRRPKKLFQKGRLHKAMVKTAWKAMREVDAIFWVLDASKCCIYGDYMPECASLDGIAVGPPVSDAWWMHPELAEEQAFLAKIRRTGRQVHVVLNKIDLLREMDVDVDQFTLNMREQLDRDLGPCANGEPILKSLWPTSVLHEPESLWPIRAWLCEKLPRQSP